MNSTATTTRQQIDGYQTTVTSWELVVVVAVLGTLLGVIAVAGSVWVCSSCGIGHARRKWWWLHKQYRDQEGMFPPHREIIQLGQLPGSQTLRQYNISPQNNNSGISRGLGLRASYPADQIPTLPSPRSWTPSPPFTPQPVPITPLNPPLSSNNIPPQTRQHEGADGESHEQYVEDYQKILYGSQARTSPYNPRNNTPVSENWSLDGSSASCPSRDLNPSDDINSEIYNHSPKQGYPHARKCGREAILKTPRMCRQDRLRNEARAHHDRRSSFVKHKLNSQDPLENTLELLKEDHGGYSRNVGQDLPAACSSSCSARKHHAHTSYPKRHKNNFSASWRGPMDAIFYNPFLGAQTDPNNNYSNDFMHYRPNRLQTRETLPTSRKAKGLKNVPRRCRNISQAISTDDGSKERRNSKGNNVLRSHVVAAEVHPESHTSGFSCQHQDQTDRLIARQIAMKYGFCQSCGIQKTFGKHGRSFYRTQYTETRNKHTQTDWQDVLSSAGDIEAEMQNLTPSLSWDNLTLNPSPIVVSGAVGAGGVNDVFDTTLIGGGWNGMGANKSNILLEECHASCGIKSNTGNMKIENNKSFLTVDHDAKDCSDDGTYRRPLHHDGNRYELKYRNSKQDMDKSEHNSDNVKTKFFGPVDSITATLSEASALNIAENTDKRSNDLKNCNTVSEQYSDNESRKSVRGRLSETFIKKKKRHKGGEEMCVGTVSTVKKE